MSKNWTSQGLVWDIDKVNIPWLGTHMAVPVINHLEDDVFRAYFCSRDYGNRSRIGFFDFDINLPKTILNFSQRPVLEFGDLGAFDDCGVTPTAIIHHDGKYLLYYVGWSRSETVRFGLFAGLAISEDGENFYRHSLAPILERSSVDPYLTATSSVLRLDGRWLMWYVSGDGWRKLGDETYPRYNIKLAVSKDGTNWDRKGRVCIDYDGQDEYAIAKPSVIFEEGVYKMWFCAKGNEYKIHYAESSDGAAWVRKGEINMRNDVDDFDSLMQAYPSVIAHKGAKYMLYNGNEYGLHGIGLAKSRDE